MSTISTITDIYYSISLTIIYLRLYLIIIITVTIILIIYYRGKLPDEVREWLNVLHE